VLTVPRPDALLGAAPDLESRDADRLDAPAPSDGGADRPGLLELVLLVTAAIEVGVATSDFVLEPLLDGTGGPWAQVRAVLVVVAAVALVRRGRARDEVWPDIDRTEYLPVVPRDGMPRVLTSLHRVLRDPGCAAVPLAVHLTPNLAELFWDGPPPPAPRPWAPTPSGWVWETDPARLGPSRHRRSPLPALVALGTTPTGTVWLNLAAFDRVTLTGDAGDRDAAFDAIIHQLETEDADGAAELLVIHPAAATRDPDRGAGDVERVVSALWQHRAAAYRHEAGQGSRRLRARSPLPPLVVVIGPDAPPTTVKRILDVARGDHGVTCLVPVPVPDADLRLTLDGHELSVPFLGPVALQPCWEGGPGPAADPEPDAAPRPEPAAPDSSPPPLVEPRPSVVVRLLGPVTVEGAPEALGPQSVELIAYLACHRDGARVESIRAALWPVRPSAHNTLHRLASVTRRALGRDVDGQQLLLPLRGHVGRLAAAVRCDLTEVEDALAFARAEPAGRDEAARRLERALALVRGRPFDGAEYQWAHTELQVARAQRVCTEAAHHLSTLALDRDDDATARWASQQGLRVNPNDRVLRHDRKRAGGARGPEPTDRDPRHEPELREPVVAVQRDAAQIFRELREWFEREAAAEP